MNKALILWVVVAGSSASWVQLSAREWTRASDGAKIEGEFIRMKDADTAYIARAGGLTIEVPVALLSEEDREFIEAKVSEVATPEGEKPAMPEGETEVTLAGVHLCCGGCKKSVEAAVSDMADLRVIMTDDSITVGGKSGKSVQKALDAIAAAGFYGVSDNEAVAIAEGAAGDEEVGSVTVSGVHLCCGKCVRAIDDIVAGLDGAAEHDAEKGTESFTITGEKIVPAAVLASLRAAGLNGAVK
ncbi:MAG: SHD1 domain-containing protein [Verrucomicrobiales bacterium]